VLLLFFTLIEVVLYAYPRKRIYICVLITVVCIHCVAGCMVAEMATGQPLFPGDSDVEQLALILACLGPLCPKHAAIIAATPAIAGKKASLLRSSTPKPGRYQNLL
jgi:hypothetical protein